MAIEASPRVAAVPTATMQLDIMLPSQYFGQPRKQAPEERLMIAVLRDALDCIEKYRLDTSKHGRRLFCEANQWFLANEAEWPYSFEWICGLLDLDSNAVRQRLAGAARSPTSIRATHGSSPKMKRVEAVGGAMSPVLPQPTGQGGTANGRHGITAAGPLGSRLLTSDVGRKMEEMERVFGTAGNHADQMEALATLRSWQCDSRLDGVSRHRANVLVWKYQPNGWDEV